MNLIDSKAQHVFQHRNAAIDGGWFDIVQKLLREFMGMPALETLERHASEQPNNDRVLFEVRS